jgi:uncharacterized membrane protein YtjA (UPF0391 family)
MFLIRILSIRLGMNVDCTLLHPLKMEVGMLYYSIVFLVVAIVAGLLGFGGIAGTATGIAKILFFVFLVLFVLSLLFGRRKL